MNILIVFDSFFGNTEKVAREIAGSLSSGNNVRSERVGADNSDLYGIFPWGNCFWIFIFS